MESGVTRQLVSTIPDRMSSCHLSAINNPHTKMYSTRNHWSVSQHRETSFWTSRPKAAFRFLMREYQLHDSASGFLIRDGQFIHNRSSEELYVLPISVPFSNCTCHLYVDNSQHLQVSIVRFPINHIWFSITWRCLALRKLRSPKFLDSDFTDFQSFPSMTWKRSRSHYYPAGLYPISIISTKRHVYLRFTTISYTKTVYRLWSMRVHSYWFLQWNMSRLRDSLSTANVALHGADGVFRAGLDWASNYPIPLT